MRIRKLLYTALVALAVLMIFANQVYAQTSPSTAKITKLDKPTAVAVGKPLTISVTVSYNLQSQFEWLLVALQDSFSETDEANPNPFPTIANSCPVVDRPWNQSVCLYHGSSGVFTVSFTLTAPNHPARWDLYAVAVVVAMDPKVRQPIQLEPGDVKGFQVAVTLSQIESVTPSTAISTTSIPTTVTSQVSQTTMLSQPTSNLAQLGPIAAIIGAIALGSLLLYSKRDKLRNLRE